MPQVKLDFSTYIANRTRGFTGRERVFALPDQQLYAMGQGRLWRG